MFYYPFQKKRDKSERFKKGGVWIANATFVNRRFRGKPFTGACARTCLKKRKRDIRSRKFHKFFFLSF